MAKTQRQRGYNLRKFRRQAIVFAALTAIVLLVIVYFAFSSATILITPKVQQRLAQYHVTVGPSATPAEDGTTPFDLSGTIKTTTVKVTKSFEDLATVHEEPDRVSGTVTLHNNWSQAQPLQAGTRLLSEGGVLFRTGSRVDIPVGGTMDVVVLADEPGTAGAIGPSRFEIVALWDGLKPLIYGESTIAFTGGTKKIRLVTQDDINNAQKVVLDAADAQGTMDVSAGLPDTAFPDATDILALQHRVIKETSGAVAGDEVPSFTYSAEVEVTAVVGTQSAYTAKLGSLIGSQIGSNERLIGFSVDELTATVQDADAKEGSATLAVLVPLKIVVRLSDPMFDRSNLVSRDRQELLSHFSQFDAIASAEVRFFPFWVIRSPSLPDHINIKLLDVIE